MKKNIAFIVIVSLFLFLYLASLNNFFFQDDFLLLDISRADNFHEVLNFFQPIKGFPYRPLATHFFYFILQSLFGINHQVFHLVTLLWLIANIALVYKLFFLILGNKKISLLGAFFYALSPVHYMTLFWVATFYFTQGATFFFLGLYFYLKSRLETKKGLYALSLAFYILGSLSNEAVLVLPGLLISYEILFKKIKTKSIPVLLQTLPFFVLGGSILLFRLIFAGVPQAVDYSLEFNLSFFSTLKWYLLRSLALPEGIRFVPHKTAIVALLTIFLGILVIGPLRSLSVSFKRLEIKKMIFGIIWFFLGALPFFFLPGHLSSYYLEISIVGFILILITWWKTSLKTNKYLLCFMLLSYFLLSRQSLADMQATHWVNRRGTMAKELAAQISNSCLNSGEDYEIILKLKPEDTEEAKVVLYEDRAAKVICNGPYHVSYDNTQGMNTDR